jgi:MYXO-CTERM domain-containing protein
MKVKTLALAAGATALMAAGTATASPFIGVEIDHHNTWTNDLTGQTHDVYRLYAVFDTDSGASLTSLFAPNPNAGEPVHIYTKDGTPFFRSTSFGSPTSNTVQAGDGTYNFVNSGQSGDPAGGLDNTTYYTIGLENGYDPDFDNDASLSPGAVWNSQWSAGVAAGDIFLQPGSGADVFFVEPGAPQSQQDADGRVLMMQLTVNQGTDIKGQINLGWNDLVFGGSGEEFVTFSTQTLPAPGAIALLGLAGLVGTRRRRA